MSIRRPPRSPTSSSDTRARRLIPLIIGAVFLAGIACWINAPGEDPYAGLDRSNPHPREGGRLCIEGSEACVVHAPNLDVARHAEGPNYWREHLTDKPLVEIFAAIGKPNVERTAPSGRMVRFWWSFCAADDQPGKWVVHLMIESSTALPAVAEKIQFLGGGAVIQGETLPERPPALSPPNG